MRAAEAHDIARSAIAEKGKGHYLVRYLLEEVAKTAEGGQFALRLEKDWQKTRYIRSPHAPQLNLEEDELWVIMRILGYEVVMDSDDILIGWG